MKPPKPRKRLLILLGAPTLVIISVIGWIFASVVHANRAAEHFCNEIAIGGTVTDTLTLASQKNVAAYVSDSQDGAIFSFPTCVPARATCRIDAKNGIITAKRWHHATD